MTDPLDVLRGPDGPADPDPNFTARLRMRLERALAAPEGVAVSTTALDLPAEPGGPAGPAGPDGAASVPTTALTPYLAVGDARAAIAWYRQALGAALAEEPIEMPDGRIGHAELRVGGARLYLADEFPELNLRAPAGASSVTLHLEVTDVDGVIATARNAGATVEREPGDHPHGRSGSLLDPFGHRWLLQHDLAGRVSAPVPPPVSPLSDGDGDVGYFSLWVPDLDRAQAFYGAVLGWTFVERGPHARMVTGALPRALVALDAPNAEFWPDPRPGAFTSRAVADIDAAVARVRAAGGRSTDPQDTPYGRSADCVDDQGLPFSLHERGPGEPRPATNGVVEGDVAYLTFQVPDSGAARAFHAAVFGWTFTPGRIQDGWAVEGPAPMTGMSGGHREASIVPMYRVEDVAAAVERVRAAGGNATDPAAQAYGISAECTDDQGLPFWLGQL